MTYYLIQHCTDRDYAIIGTANGQSTDFFTQWYFSIDALFHTLRPCYQRPPGTNWHTPSSLLARHTLIATSTDFSLTHPEFFL